MNHIRYNKLDFSSDPNIIKASSLIPEGCTALSCMWESIVDELESALMLMIGIMEKPFQNRTGKEITES